MSSRRLLLSLLLIFSLPLTQSLWSAEGFTLAIDIGHSPKRPGATSSRGKPEYGFNRSMAEFLLREIQRRKVFSAFVINSGGREISLAARTTAAQEAGADLLLSLHHDSVQPHYLSPWRHEGKEQRFSDQFSGHSLFISNKNPEFNASQRFANLLGQQLLDQGLTPSLHHAEKIKGENRPLLDKDRGIYRFDNLVVLRQASMPALLLECGIILNRDEELRVSSPAYRQKIADAIIAAVLAYRQQPTGRDRALESTEHETAVIQ